MLTSNPNRTFSFLLPDAIQPWVYVPLTRQIQQVGQVQPLLAQIPDQASVAATTYLIPPLSSRRAIVRFPDLMQIRNDTQQVEDAKYIVADLWQLQQYQPAFKSDRHALQESVTIIDRIIQNHEYSILNF